MGRGTLALGCDGSGDPPGGLVRVGGPLGRSGTSSGTLPKVRDGSGEPTGGLGRVGEGPG